jgi:septum formation protein
MTHLILASTSPRRAELLRQIGVDFVQRAVDIDEAPYPAEVAAQTALRLARSKAEAGRALAANNHPTLAADTLLGFEGATVGKPRDREDFIATMRRLSGRKHEVYTAVALAQPNEIKAFLSVSHVFFRPLSDDEITAYWDTGEPADKAGGYAIQGLAGAFITRLEGSYSGVMGLPLFETAELLRAAGVPLWRTQA